MVSIDVLDVQRLDWKGEMVIFGRCVKRYKGWPQKKTKFEVRKGIICNIGMKRIGTRRRHTSGKDAKCLFWFVSQMTNNLRWSAEIMRPAPHIISSSIISGKQFNALGARYKIREIDLRKEETSLSVGR